MARQQDVGQMGEDLATEYLFGLGYSIKERNWRFSRAEIDIIAFHDDTLIFVEVKTRSYDYYGQPEESISAKKERLICDAAAAYMSKNEYEWAFRFDIISILLSNTEPVIKHYEDAFFPGI